MNFKEKVRHMVKMGVPANRIVEEKTPYVAKNLLSKFGDDVAVVYIFGKKDAGRLKGGKKKDGSPSYFQDFKKNKLDSLLQGYQSIRKLTSSETEAWPMTLRSAAFRFWISRLYDWYVPREATLLTPKDPTQFERILLKRKSEMKEKPC